jgi:hypothetical protein
MTEGRGTDDKLVSVEDARGLTMQARLAGSLPAWVVTRNPDDYPGLAVARLHLVSRGEARCSAYAMVRPSVGELEAALGTVGLLKLYRAPEDHAVVVSTWM